MENIKHFSNYYPSDCDFKMNSNLFLYFLLSSIFFVTFLHADENEMKTIGDFLKRFEKINVEEILQNERLFSNYHKCFMETGPCTAEAREMRNIIPTLVKSACQSCTDDQKREMKKHLDYAKYNRNKEWEEILDKFDPTRETLEKFLTSVPSA